MVRQAGLDPAVAERFACFPKGRRMGPGTRAPTRWDRPAVVEWLAQHPPSLPLPRPKFGDDDLPETDDLDAALQAGVRCHEPAADQVARLRHLQLIADLDADHLRLVLARLQVVLPAGDQVEDGSAVAVYLARFGRGALDAVRTAFLEHHGIISSTVLATMGGDVREIAVVGLRARNLEVQQRSAVVLANLAAAGGKLGGDDVAFVAQVADATTDATTWRALAAVLKANKAAAPRAWA